MTTITSNKNLSDAMLQAMPYAVIWLNTQGDVAWLNQSAKQLLGRDWEGLKWEQVMRSCFKQGQPDGLEVATHDGRLLQVLLSTLDNEPGQLITLVDVTPSRTLQRHIAHQQRLTSIGQMTAQLAHQLRTPLASAMLLTDRLEATCGGDISKKALGQMKQCHLSIEQQIQDLLAYCRGDSQVKALLSVKDWFCQWQEQVTTYVHKAQGMVKFSNEVCHSAVLYANQEALSGCLFNLLNNALQAEATCINIKVYPIWDQLIAIDVKDNGYGMTKEVAEQACCPFVTTKAKGTGLGLAVVEATIGQHSGTVTIESEPGNGTLVRIILPLRNDNASTINS